MESMSILTLPLKRLYEKKQITKNNVISLFKEKKITENEMKYILEEGDDIDNG